MTLNSICRGGRGNDYLKLVPAIFLGLLASIILPFPVTSECRAETDAQTVSEPADLTGLSIEELMKIKIDTVYGASGYEQLVTEAPASVSIVTSDEIKKYGYRTLADLLQAVRGFSITNDRNYSYAGIRGFGRPGDLNSRFLLLVDGIRQNDSIYDMAAIGTDFILDIDLVERVEIIRGPSYSLYGSNALLAVVNVITRKVQGLDGVEISGDAGSFGTYKGRFSYGKRIGPGIETLLSGSIYDSAGQDLFFQKFDSPATNNGWAVGCDGDRFGSAFAKVTLRDFTLEGAFISRTKVIPTASYKTVFNNPGTKTVDERAFLDLKYEHNFSGEFSMLSRISFHQYNYDGRYMYDRAVPGGPDALVANIDTGRDAWWGGEIQFTRELFNSHKLIWGGEFRDIFRMDQKNYDTSVYVDDKRHSWNGAFYVQDEYEILEDLILNAGLRYDHFETFGDTVNPRIALIYSPFSLTTLKFIYGTAFRAPNGYELYYADVLTMKPNPELKEEKITSYELVLEQYLGSHFRGTVVGYYSLIRDLISQTTDPNDGLLIFRNLGRAEIKGVELELEGKLDSGLTGRASYAWQDARNARTGEWLTNSARHLVKINLQAPLVKERVFVGLEEQYTSRKKTVTGNEAGSFFITNVTLFSRNLLKNLEVSGSVYNLFDKKYGVPVGAEIPQDIIEQDGRSFRVKITYQF